MRALGAGLQAHLGSGATTLSQCWRLETSQAQVLGFTDHDEDIVFGGVTYEAATGFDASSIEASLGLSVDNLDVAGALRSDRLSAAKLAAGDYDNAAVEIWRVNWADPSQRVLMRRGHLGEVSHGDLGFSAEVRGLAHLLNQPHGRVFSHGCDAVLGDARCGVNLAAASFRGVGAVIVAEQGMRLTVSGLATFAAGWFARGLLSWTSGANAGHRMDVKHHRVPVAGTHVLELWQPMSAAVSAGDGFTVTAGCDKQFATCRVKFANAVNFRGFPAMPGNDFVGSYPVRGEG